MDFRRFGEAQRARNQRQTLRLDRVEIVIAAQHERDQPAALGFDNQRFEALRGRDLEESRDFLD